MGLYIRGKNFYERSGNSIGAAYIRGGTNFAVGAEGVGLWNATNPFVWAVNDEVFINMVIEID